VRLDVGLFALRRFKSRTQAANAIERGQVLLNDRPARPGQVVKVGDRITFLDPRGERTLEILELPRASLRRQDAERLVREIAGPGGADRESDLESDPGP